MKAIIRKMYTNKISLLIVVQFGILSKMFLMAKKDFVTKIILKP